jgi:hypothetical protein
MAIGIYGPEYLQFDGGGPARNVPVFVFLPGTKTKATLFADKGGQYTAPNPVYTDVRGELVFLAQEGFYDLYMPTGDLTVAVTVEASSTGGPGTGPGGYEHTVISPSLLVQINHGLDWKPFPLSIDSLGDRVEEERVTYPSPGIVEVKFGAAFGPGKIYLS